MCGKVTKKEEPKDYDDFITKTPEPVIFINDEQKEVAHEHSEIIRALIGKNMTAKEIHALYWNAEKEEYNKTIKTVYRYLETLEEVGLVQICGHRKPQDSRLTEQLYCRTANVFYLVDERTKTKWWETEKGTKYFTKISNLLQALFDIPDDKIPQLIDLLREFSQKQEEMTLEMYRKTPDNKVLTEVFSKADLYEIKDLANRVTLIGVMFRHPDLCDRIHKMLSK
ncbi:MAG: hypothetical protein ACFFD8_06730 [Candidatus Thorarchaeota archaeon]